MGVDVLPIGIPRTDGGTQMRAEIDNEVINEYRDKWVAGVKFPPVDVFHDGKVYWLADGFHRFYGAREAKLKEIPVRVRRGGLRDAILFATGANTTNGVRRTNADKRRAVETLLNDEEWCLWSDHKIAEAAGVGVDLVGTVRRKLSESDSSSPAAEAAEAPRMGRDGKKRKPPKRVTRKDGLGKSEGIQQDTVVAEAGLTGWPQEQADIAKRRLKRLSVDVGGWGLRAAYRDALRSRISHLLAEF